MIGIDHEPSRAILDALNEALGEGQYSIAYHDGPNGVDGIIRTRTQPPREFTTRFARDAVNEQVEAVWQELVARTTATLKHEREQEEAAARAYRAEPTPENEVKPGEAVPAVRITEQTDVTESESDLVEGTRHVEAEALGRARGVDAVEAESAGGMDLGGPPAPVDQQAAENTLGDDHARVEGGTGSSESPSTGGGEHFDSSTVDEERGR